MKPLMTPQTELLRAAAELLDALNESCEKETALWLDLKSSDRVYRARRRLARALARPEVQGMRGR